MLKIAIDDIKIFNMVMFLDTTSTILNLIDIGPIRWCICATSLQFQLKLRFFDRNLADFLLNFSGRVKNT